MNDANRHVLTLFAELLDAGTLEAQAAYLDRVCGSDADLRTRLEALLRAHRDAGHFLGGETSAPEYGAIVDASAHGDRPGMVIGPYKLLQQIGEGGMGTVYMAEQTQPVQRRVALKIIKPGMDSRQVIARFEAERQALALMDHPNIARVLDAGTINGTGEPSPVRGRVVTPDDTRPLTGLGSPRPYFVMELVKGVPITKYCDERRLTPRKRLELFLPVCQAVQHAHQKGIIHRDLKPSNVLVAEYDDKPVAKVIDFGIAKATGPKLTDRTMFTELGQVIGTLEYMSPEQAKLNALDIDTRSDIYSLGVLLYELLTGTTPFEKKRLHQAAFDEILRLIREEEPQKPSTRLSTTDELPSIASNRGLEPKKLSGLMRGELDWIVMKALEKDRNRRYESANGFAMDILRYLHDEPVLAGPPRMTYRLRKFFRRNRGPVLAGAMLLLALVAGIIGTTVGLVRAQQARDSAENAEQNEREQRQLADGRLVEADTARKEAAARAIAETQARKAREVMLTDLYTTFGLFAAERDDPRQAVLWFANAGRLAGDDRDRAEANRVRAASWERLVPRPVRAVVHPAEWLEGIAVHPGGLHMLTHGYETARGEGDCQLWDLDCQERVPFPHPEGPVSAATWDSMGDRLALGTPNGQVTVLHYSSKKVLQQVPFAGRIDRLLFSPDGRYLVLAAGRRVRVWDCRQAVFATPELDHPTPVTTLAIHPEGRQLATACQDHSCRVFTVPAESDRPVFPLVRHYQLIDGRFVGQKPIPPVYVDAGRGLLTVTQGIVSWSDTATGKVVRTFQLGGSVDAVCASPDGNFVAVANPVRAGIWTATTGTLVRSFSLQPRAGVNTQYILSLAFSPDSKVLATGSGDHTARLWSVSTGTPLRGGLLNHPTSVDVVAFLPDGRHLVTAARGGLIRVWELPPADLCEHRLPHLIPSSLCKLSRDGRYVLPSGGQVRYCSMRSTQVYDIATGKAAGPVLPARGILVDAAFSPDGRQVALAASLERYAEPPRYGGRLVLWDWRQGRQVVELKLPLEANKLDYSPDGQYLAVGNAQGQVVLLDAANGKPIRQWKAHDSPMLNNQYIKTCAVRFTPDSQSIITYGWRVNSARVWDVATGTLRFKFDHRDTCVNVQCSGDGRRLATSSYDNTVCIWDLATGRRLARLAHPDWVFNAVFSPDGKRVLTACRDGMARLWDWRAGQLVCPALAHQHEVFAVAFTPGGRRLLTSGDDGKLRLWEPTTGKPLIPPLSLGGMGRTLSVTPNGSRVVAGGFGNALLVFCLTDWLDPGSLAPDDLCTWGEILSDQRVHEGGGVTNLTAEEWLDRWRAFSARPSGRVKLARELGMRNQAVAKRGPDPEILTLLHNLAATAQSAGRLPEAIRLYEQVREQRIKTLGPDDPDTLTTMNSLGTAYWSAKQLARSVPMFEETLKRRTTTLGADHPETLRTMANLAVNYRDAGRLPRAVALMEEAILRGRKLPAPLPSQVSWVLPELAALYHRTGQLAKAEPLYRGFLEQAKKQFGAHDLRTSGTLAQLGANLLRQNKYTQAEPFLRACLEIREKQQPEAWTTFQTKSQLGASQLGQKKYAEAEPQLLAAYQGLKQRAPGRSGELIFVVLRLIEVYDGLGKKDEAARWRKERETLEAPRKPKETY